MDQEGFTFVEELRMEDCSSVLLDELCMPLIEERSFVEELELDSLLVDELQQSVVEDQRIMGQIRNKRQPKSQATKLVGFRQIFEILQAHETTANSQKVDQSLGFIGASEEIVENISGISRSESSLQLELSGLKTLLEMGFLTEQQFKEKKLALSKSLGLRQSVPSPPELFVSRLVATATRSKERETMRERFARVFVSSTFVDMKSEREVLMKKAFPQLQAQAKSAGVQLTPIDLRWGITAEQSKQGNTVLLCLRQVQLCRPWFVAILGDRYGWSQSADKVDPLLALSLSRASSEFPFVKSYLDRSVTELEIRCALFSHSRDDQADVAAARQNAVIFIKASSEVSDPRMDQLKKDLVNIGVRIVSYTQSDEILAPLIEHFSERLSQVFPLEDLPNSHELELIGHSTFRKEKTQCFVGGSQYLNAIDEALCSNNICFVSGLAGKSAVLANWATLRRRLSANLLISYFVGATPNSYLVSSMLRYILSEIKDYFQFSKELADRPSGLIDQLPEFLLEASMKGGLILVIDGLNHLQDDSPLSWLPIDLPSNVQVVLSGASSLKVSFPTILIEPLQRFQIEEIASSQLHAVGKSLARSQLETLCAAPQCTDPLFLRILVDELKLFGHFEQLDQSLIDYLAASSAEELVQKIIHRLQSDLTHPNSLPLALGCIACSKQGLTEEEVLAICALKNCPLTLPEWVSCYSSLGDILVRSGNALRCSPRFFSTFASNTSIRSTLLQYWSSPSVDKQRVLHELPFQYFHLADASALSKFLSDSERFSALIQQSPDIHQYFALCDQSALFSSPLLTKAPSSSVDYENLLTVGKFLMEAGFLAHSETIFRLLAESIQQQGQYRVALELLLPVLSTELEKSPTEPQEVLRLITLLHRTATVRRKSGLYRAAQEDLNRAFALLPLVNNSTDVVQGKLAALQSELGVVYQNLANYEAAETLMFAALASRKRTSQVSAEISCCYQDLGDLFILSNRFREAEENLRMCLDMRRSLWGQSHLKIAEALTSLAACKEQQGLYAESEELFKEAVEMRRKTLGNDHPDTAESLYSFANCLIRQGKSGPKEYLEDAMRIYEKSLGGKHPKFALAVSSLGMLLRKEGNHSKAELFLRQALNIFTETYGREHTDVAGTLLNLAGICQITQRYEEAESLYLESLQSFLKLVGFQHYHTSVVLNDLAILYYSAGRMNDSEQTYRVALECNQQLFGGDHPSTAQFLLNFAEFQKRNNKPDEAEELFIASLRMFAKCTEPTNKKRLAAEAAYEKSKAASATATLDQLMDLLSK